MENMDPRLVAAVVAAVTSVITLILSFLFKSFWERHFYVFKLDTEYKYEQRKKLKDILAKNKMQLLNTCESLNHRLWNFATNYKYQWHNVKGNYESKGNYYFNSFVYRIICVFAWIKKIEDEMVYLDTTIALTKDLEFIKYIRLLPQIFFDVMLFKGFDYDENRQTDHFFRNNLETMAQSLITDMKEVCTFTQFEESLDKYMKSLYPLCLFLDGIFPEEPRLRWDRLQVFHLALIAFLNSFGYDFQITPNNKIMDILGKPRRSRLLRNFKELLQRNKLTEQKEFKNLLKLMAV